MKIFKSKIAYGFYIAVFLIVSLPIGSMVLSNAPIDSILIYSGVIFLIFVFIGYVVFSIRYIIDGNILKIRNGFIYNENININDIKSIKKSNSLISSPAVSFDRIEICYGKYGSFLVSPDNKHLFIENLISINPNIQNNLKAS